MKEYRVEMVNKSMDQQEIVLDALAERGWRLVTVVPADRYAESFLMYLERDKHVE